MRQIMKAIVDEVTEVLDGVKENEIEKLAMMIHQSPRIFIAGTGRSGLIGKAFAMRLMHSGYTVYVAGETTTPSIQKDDLFIIISGSGNTSTLTIYAEKAKKAGAKLALVTTNKTSEIGQLSEMNIGIPAATKKRAPEEPETIQPLGNQFDQAAHLLLDAMLVYLNQRFPKDNHFLINRHANLE